MQPITSQGYIDSGLFHNDNNLLFLFILANFIETAEVINAIHLLCGQGAPVIEGKQDTPCDKKSSIETIEKLIYLLVGSSNISFASPRYFNWRTSEGFLPKLRHYCILFQQKEDGIEKDGVTIQHYVEKVMTECLAALETLYQEDRTAFLKAIEKADSALQRLAKVLTRQITQFKDNENVMYFVIKNREKLDKIYGTRFVAKLLNKMYAKGIREAQQFLIRKYHDRGFDKIVLEIAKKMSELEASI